MSLLQNLKSDESIAGERDSVGNSGPVESGLYPSKIALAYISKSDGGAMALNVTLKSESGREIRNQFWMTSGTAKGGNNFYLDKEGAKQYLPGFLAANSLALLTLGKEIAELSTEQKVINLYSKEAKAEVPTKVDMVTDLLGQDIIAGVIRQIVDKTVKNDAGVYVANGETRAENEIDKFFRHRDRMTTAEIRAQATEPAFITTWEDKWAGKDRMKAKGAAAGGVVGAPKAGANAATAKPKTSLFA